MAKKVQKSKAVAKKVAKPVASKVAKPAAKKAVKAVAKKVAKPIAKKAAKPVAKKVVKPAAKKAVKAVAKKVAKPVAKKAAKPVAKKAVKPVAKAVKKVSKPLAKKVAPKKTVKPVAKKLVKVALSKGKAKIETKKVVKTAPKKVAKVVEKKTAKAVQKVAVKPLAKKVVEVDEIKKDKPARRRGKKLPPPPPMIPKPIPVKPKTVAELIEANKIPVDKKFPVSKRELKTVARPSYDNTSLYGNDKPVKAPIIGKTKFNDSELTEFKNLINNKLSEAIKDYELLKDTLSHRDNNGTDDTSPTFKLLEDGSEVMSKEETTQLAIRQEKFIQNLKNALIRIENKTYGVCRATGNMISKDRLRSVPHATLSIEAKREQN
jgi:RNA polymerase-binding transcription factor DksA